MTFDYFEGAAGTGKTHNLVARASELVQDRILGNENRLLALTFMNGARRRLNMRLGENPVFHKRFDCQTFDAFARILAARRRSLIGPILQEQASALDAFDGPCFMAAALLENEAVCQWVARGFPLVLVDEAQDLDVHRLRILQGLSRACHIVSAADAFQCLTDGQDTASLFGWLEGSGQTHRLTQPQRTHQRGLLAAALAIREGRDVKSTLTASTFNNRKTWRGEGFRLLEAPATKRNHAPLSWSIANEISQHQGQFAILTPDARNGIVRDALTTVQTRQWSRKNSSVTFGPYPHVWDRHDAEEVNTLLAGIVLPEQASLADLRTILTPLVEQASIPQVLNRLDRLRKVQGQTRFPAAQVVELIHDAFRNQSRLGFRQHSGHLAMTIQHAKNREFPNVIVLWPHSVTGSSEHLRRLLYNGITRAQNHCTVIVIGQGRLSAPPFAP